MKAAAGGGGKDMRVVEKAKDLKVLSEKNGTITYEITVEGSLTLNGKSIAMPCDKWDRLADNIYAVAKHIDALRGQERWGVGSIDRAFTGYAALPDPHAKKHWREVLLLTSTATLPDIKEAYRELARLHGPDKGGDPEKWHEIQEAYEAGIEWCRP